MSMSKSYHNKKKNLSERSKEDKKKLVRQRQWESSGTKISQMLMIRAQIARCPGYTADNRQASRGAVQGTSSSLKVRWDHRRSKNQLLRLPVASCDCTPATFAFAGASEVPPPRSGFAMRDPPKLKLALPSILGKPRVEPCLAASRRSLTAVS